MLQIYTDGGCRNNPGLGAWAFVPVLNGEPLGSYNAAVEHTTNNRMELLAVHYALIYASRTLQPDIVIYTDSQYVVNVMNEWAAQWVAKGTIRMKKNHEQIEQMYRLHQTIRHRVRIQWVKGHADNRLNNLADRLVNEAMDGFTPPLPSQSEPR